MNPEPGESVFFHGHPSWRSMLAFHFKGLILAILAGVIAGVATAIAANHVQVGWVVVGVGVVLLASLLVGFVRRQRTTYTITDRRLTVEVGLMSRNLHQTRIERVQNVNSHQRLAERLLQVGTVNFDTAGSAEFDFSFRGVSRPREIVRTVDRAIHEFQQMGPPGRSGAPDSTS